MKSQVNKDTYELICNTQRDILQPFFIEMAIKGGYDELLYIYDKNNAEVEEYVSQNSQKILAETGLKLFCDGNKIEKLLQKEKFLAKRFDDFIETIKLENVKSSNKVWLKNKLADYYNHFVRYCKIYRFTESFYSPLVDQTIRSFVTKNIEYKNLVNYALSILLNPSAKEKVTKKREKILSSINADKNITCLCQSVRQIGKAKLAMRSKLNRYWGIFEIFLEEISKKLFLTPVQTKSLFCSELAVILESGKKGIDKNILDKANRRSELFVAKKVNDIYIYYTGQDAKRIANSVRWEINENISEISGDVASVGYAKGKVIIMPFGISKKGNEKLWQKMAMMEKGNIIVAANTGPDMIMACRKAGAIVADEGGINSHAAIISRELEIPGIVNTKIATKALNDGDIVEVDANKGIIKILKKYGR